VADRRSPMPDDRVVLERSGRLVSPHVAERLPADAAGVCLGGVQQTVTVLFADLRGYTALAERLPPEQLLATLNGHLTVAVRAVRAFEGTISQFTGDQLMALFNSPLAQPDHALRAVRAAIRIRQATDIYHASIPAELQMDFGMGIATGEAIVGHIGAQEMSSYTAIGDTVNLAARLQELAQGREILLVDVTRRALVGEALPPGSPLSEAKGSPSADGPAPGVPAGHTLSDRGVTWIRGRREPVHVYALEDVGHGGGRSRFPVVQEAQR
jgi:class 3 adenylate cyclase